MARATVREWHDDLGWGVLDCAETPGGCWAHYSAIATPIISASPAVIVGEYKSLTAGQIVELSWESPGQDGFDFRASLIRAP
jgi:CspA family cold shock protein